MAWVVAARRAKRGRGVVGFIVGLMVRGGWRLEGLRVGRG